MPLGLLLAKLQESKSRNAFNNNIAANINLPKTQLFRITQCSGFLSVFLKKISDPLTKVVIPLGKRILAILGVTASASAISP